MAGSGPKIRPRERRKAFNRSCTTPGCTQTLSASARTMRRKWLEKSSTKPGPSDSPARPAGVDRQVLGGRILHTGHDVCDRPRSHDAQRLDLIDAGVARVELQKE